MLKKRWKTKAVMLTLAVVGGITFSVLTNITVLAQTSSDRSAISQSSANNAEYRRNKVGSDRTDQNGASTDYVNNITHFYVSKKPPIICRSRAIRTWLRWKCPKVR